MAAIKSVIVLAPNGRRQTVNVTPNSTILQILEEVCKKHGYNVDEYDLKHFNKILDSNAILRFVTLPNKAQLEMVACTKKRSIVNVTIGIQLENGERVMSVFEPIATLSEVLENICPDKNLEEVGLIYMHQEINGFDTLKKTTLKSLGLTCGRAIFRLIKRDPGQIVTQAHVITPLMPKLSKTINILDTTISNTYQNESSMPSTSKNVSKSIITKNAKKNDKMELSDTEHEDIKKCEDGIKRKTNESNTCSLENQSIPLNSDEHCLVKSLEIFKEENNQITELLNNRNAMTFNQEGAQALPTDELPDDFYDLTVNDAKVLLRDAKRCRKELEEAPLLTDAQRQLNQQKHLLIQLHKYRRTVIRIQFPDQYVLQGIFGPLETVQMIKDFIKEHLTDPNCEFTIYTTPPKQILNPDARLIDVNLVPSAIIRYCGPSALKSEVKKQAINPKDASIQVSKIRKEMKREEKLKPTVNLENNTSYNQGKINE